MQIHYPILVDTSVGSNDLVDYEPLNKPPLSDWVRLTPMDYGDVFIMGNGPDNRLLRIGVELKSVDDLVSSIQTGRLQGTQLPGMLGDSDCRGAYDICWLLCYGYIRRAPCTGKVQVLNDNNRWVTLTQGKDAKGKPRTVNYDYVASAMMSFQVEGVRICTVADKSQAAHWIALLAYKWSKDWDHHTLFHTFDDAQEFTCRPGTLRGNKKFRAGVAYRIPGVGYKMAVRIANSFTSVELMTTSGRDEWMKIKGVGPNIADAAVRLFQNR